jgi:hypothetical protein
MIPKTVHYCWFGRNKKNTLIEKCIASWRKYLPDYQIIEWNEDNFDVHNNQYAKEAYESKKWAFVSDYARLYILYHHGGIYFDTDVEVFKSFDVFLSDDAFTGFENCYGSFSPILTSVIGATKKNFFIKDCLDLYENIGFVKNGNLDLTTNVVRIRELMFKKYKVLNNDKKQSLENKFIIYPSYFFSVKNKYSFSFHHADSSWRSSPKRIISKFIRSYKITSFFYKKFKKFLNVSDKEFFK